MLMFLSSHQVSKGVIYQLTWQLLTAADHWLLLKLDVLWVEEEALFLGDLESKMFLYYVDVSFP